MSAAIEQFLAYNFDRDGDFQVSFAKDYPRSLLNNGSHIQNGLATLFRNAPPNYDVDHLTRRAKVFYFSKCEWVSLWNWSNSLINAKGRPA